MGILRRLAAIGAMVLVGAASAFAAGSGDVPPALAPWTEFVLHGAGEKLCPPSEGQGGARVCRFPTSLSLDVGADGADFAMRLRLFDEGAVALPSGAGVWIGEVRRGATPVPVVQGASGPAVWLPAGEYELTGRLGWKAAPPSLTVPPDIGVVRLSRQGAEARVAMTPAGELQLAPREFSGPGENRETVKVFRQVADGVPVTVTTLFRLEVSGLARTVTLAGAVLPGAIPLAVRAPVPASLGPDGGLVLDAGPGRYEVEVVSRLPGRPERLGPASCPYGPEIWSFSPAPEVREVRPEGLPAVDPKAADVPEDWQGWPAFAVSPGTTLALVTLGRGAPVGRDAISLVRDMWLDFSGQGLTVRDSLTGENRKTWTLAMAAPGELGRVTVDDRDQPVVRLGKDGLPGVELRQSHLRLVAYSRYPDASAAFPAAGYDRELERVSATLHLPPGWALAYAAGPDAVSGGLLSDWTLLDLFLVLVLAVAAMALGGKPAGLALGLFLLLSWHEPQAPATAWIFVLAGAALLRVAGEAGRLAGRPAFRRFAMLVFGLAALSLAVLSVPFVARELRLAVAPQIETPASPPPVPAPKRMAARPEIAPAPAMAPRPMADMALREEAKTMAQSVSGGGGAGTGRLDFDPNALNQTGPAVPAWTFETVGMSWRGPVTPGQETRLMLVPPGGVAFLRVCRVVLLGLALLFLLRRLRPRRAAAPGAIVLSLSLILALPGVLPKKAAAADFPPKELLDALRDRLTEPPRCLPHCLGSPGLDVRLEGGRLTLAVAVDAAASVTAPLPVVSENWRPTSVTLDGAPAPALVRQDGALAALVAPGRHTLVLSGPAPEAVSFTIAPSLAPGRVALVAPGYRARGLDGLGSLRGPLELTRAETGTAPGVGGGRSAAVPAFFEVERAIDFGLTFEVETRVTRRSPLDAAAVASVPLLPGEMPDSPDVTVAGGVGTASFAAGVDSVSWRSRLPAASQWTLAAPTAGDLVETWTVAAAPFYDVTFDGFPPMSRLGPDGAFRPKFAPWPGETLRIGVERPEPAPGDYLTLDRANLVLRQGGQVRDATLTLRFRAAKGVRHAVKLPAGSEVTRLTVAGRETLPTGGDGETGFSLPPGASEVVLHFREQAPMSWRTDTPAVDLGLEGANVQVRLELPGDRWLLATRADTPLGPAVLYWGWLAAVTAMSLGLSRIGQTPLSRLGWFCYALGLSQATPGNYVLAVAWIVALAWRRRHPLAADGGAIGFNAVQVLLTLLTLAGLAALYDTLGAGLLGVPRMQVSGGGSTATNLVWTFDRVGGFVPSCRAVTLPMLAFRGLMLLWAGWLAWSLPRWLRFGFESLTEGGGWRKMTFRMRRPRRDETGATGSDAQGGGRS